MKYRSEFPYAIDFQPNIHIILPDSASLAANLWLPCSKNSTERFPTILEYLPYGKNVGTSIRDHLTHPYFCGHGYACLRVDMRGSGESEGLMFDEYLQQEQIDCLSIIDWIVAQPWSNKNVGMMGISWGGFNSLQVAYLRPKPLKAIITLCSTDDRYSDDIHYKGGALLTENMGWAACMLCFSSSIPDPKLEPKWEEMWLNRLKNLPILIENWLLHQQRDDYWKHGSICENYKSIEAAVYAIGGWNDAYKNAVFRIAKNLTAPTKALIGPWCHKYPHFAKPTPAIGFLQEALKFWDHWLNDKPNSIMDERKIVAFIQKSHKPHPFYESLEGYWVSEDSLSSNNFSNEKLYLNTGGKLNAIPEKTNKKLTINSPLSTGKHGGEYCIIWMGAEYPTDQREDDSLSLIFETEPLNNNLCLLGTTKINFFVSSDKPFGQIIVRLSEVHKDDGQVTRITYGVLNLEYLDGFEKNIPLIIDKIYQVKMNLDDVGYEIKAGNKLRIAISNCYFPLLMPTKELSTLTIHVQEDNFIELPIYKGKPIDCPFENPEGYTPLEIKYLEQPKNKRKFSENIIDNSIKTKIIDDFGLCLYPNGIIIGEKCCEKYYAKKYDANSVKINFKWDYCAIREDMNLRVDVVNIMKFHCDMDNFYIETDIQAKKNGVSVFSNKQNKTIKRISV